MGFLRSLRQRLFGAPDSVSSTPSVFFYTFHKCASTLFSGYALKYVNGLDHVDYEQSAYDGAEQDAAADLERYFAPTGYVYGPIRLSASTEARTQRLIAHTRTEAFVRERRAMFMIRDPRDLLISRFYSFTNSHGRSAVPEIAEMQAQNRERMLEMGLERSAMHATPDVRSNFQEAARLIDACPQAVVLRYEDLVDDFDRFAEGYTRYLKVDQAVLDEIYQRSRPRETEDVSAHQRSGKVAGYKEKLDGRTLVKINAMLRDVLERFGYER